MGALLAAAGFRASAQDGGSYRMAPNKDETEVDFLANYYTQDGDHGAPQGGLGTEQLSNISGLVVVHTPIDSNSALTVSAGADYYSSASTSQIDWQPSGASSSDLRAHATVGWTERALAKGRTYGLSASVSHEYDVMSVGGAFAFAQEWDRGINELSVSLSAYHDTWKLIYPIELRSGERLLTDDVRLSYAASVTYARIVNPRLQYSLSVEPVLMSGLLSTPFHRIYFAGTEGPPGPRNIADDVERLPDQRLKLPVSLRVNWKPNDVLAVRTFYRFYTDDWGVRANTASLELAYELGEAWTLMPFYRISQQTAADYFAPYAEHTAAEEFHTSDWDLSALTTHKVGFGARYAPVFGLGRTTFGRLGLEWRQLTLRGAYYQRDPAFNSYSISVGMSMAVRRAVRR